MKYLKYLWYIIRHKWFVFVECGRKGLWWLGLVHDLSKLLPSEFFPYARYFYGSYPSLDDVHGDARNRMFGKYQEEIDGEFDFAWLLHQKRNKHHWQWWILQEDEGGVKILQIHEKYHNEMICDWHGAGMAQGHGGDIFEWWNANNRKMQLHPETRKRLALYACTQYSQRRIEQ